MNLLPDLIYFYPLYQESAKRKLDEGMHVTDMFAKERFMLTELQTDMVLPLGKYSIRLACMFFDSTVAL